MTKAGSHSGICNYQYGWKWNNRRGDTRMLRFLAHWLRCIRCIQCAVGLMGALGGAVIMAAPMNVEQVEQSVVRVFAEIQGGLATGSGAVVADEWVLTNQHVIAGATRVGVHAKALPEVRSAEVLWQSEALDLAVLKVAGLMLPVATLATAKPAKGAAVWAVGYPGASDWDDANLEATVTRGVISLFHQRAWRPGGTPLAIIQHDAAINPGNSGGPLFDDCGRVVGVNTQAAHANFAQGVFLAARISAVIPELQRLGLRVQLSAGACTTSTTPAAHPQSNHLNNLPLILAVALVALFAMVLAMRKPRQQVLRVAKNLKRNPTRIGGKPNGTAPAAKPAIADDDATVMLVLSGFSKSGQKFQLRVTADQARVRDGYIIGRHAQLADGVVEAATVSRRHARISVRTGRTVIEDLNSTNGTWLDGERLPVFTPTEVPAHSTIALGNLELQATYNH